MPSAIDGHHFRAGLLAGALAILVGGWGAGACASPAQASVPASPQIHVVRDGEWLYSIGRHYGVSPLAIARLNKFDGDHRLKAGDKVLIPGSAVSGPAPKTPAPSKAAAAAPVPGRAKAIAVSTIPSRPVTIAPASTRAEAVAVVGTPSKPAVRSLLVATQKTHIVRNGEWIYAIGRRYGVSPLAIARLNNFDDTHKLKAGDKLLIPAPGASIAAAAASAPSPAASLHAKNAVAAVETVRGPGASPAAPTASPPAPNAAAPVVHPGIPTVTVQGQPVGAAPPMAATPAVTVGPGRTFTIILGLKDGQHYLGDVEAVVGPDGSVSMSSSQALALIQPLLSTAARARLVQALGAPGQKPLRDFTAGGVTASYDSSQLQIVIAIPGAARPTESLQVADLDKAFVGSVTKPEAFSGYVNLRSAFDYVEQGADKGLVSPEFFADGAIRFHGLVFESEAQYSPDGVQPFARQGSRVVYDDLVHTMRFTLGDLEPQATGFQTDPPMVGFSVLRLYDELAPQMNVRPRGNRSFTLAQASTVETFVNGRSVQRVRLDPGTYNLSNFPFVQGANDVRLVIQNDAGVTQSLDFSIFFDRTLLRTGLSEFGAFAGVPTTLDNGNINYSSDVPTFTGFYRHGFNDQLTAGGNFQADTHTQMGGPDIVWGTPLGTLGVDVAMSHDDQLGAGYAVNAGITRLKQDPSTFKSTTMAATIEVRSEKFTTLGSVVGNNPYKLEAGLSYGRAFNEYTFANLDARYALGRNGQEDVGSLRGTVGYRVSESANVTFDVQYATGGLEDGVSFGIQFTKRFGRTSNLRTEYDSGTDTARVSYDTAHGRGVGAWSASGSLDRTGDSIDFNGSADYDFNRGEVGIAHVATYDEGAGGVSDQRTSFRLGTSIAFTGGSFGIGRPIYDSFALFQPHSTLNGATVLVDPSPDGEIAKSGIFGAGVLNDLGSYSVRSILYDVPKAPAGYDIGQGTLRVFPPYRSGYKVEVGSDYSILAIGRLLDAEGAPVSLLAGKAVQVGSKDGHSVTLFTSRDGKFGAQGLAPGTWRIEMPTQPSDTVYELVVPKTSSFMLQVGDLKPMPGGAK